MKTLLTLLVFLLLVNPGIAQEISYARSIIDTLCSPHVHGRGYVNNGHRIAAEYIAGEFEKTNLQAFGDDFFQSFDITVNTFPDQVRVEIDGKPLMPGEDFLCLPYSGSAEGTFDLVWVGKNNLKNEKALKKLSETDLSNSFLVLDGAVAEKEEHQKALQSLRYRPLGAKGVIVVQDKKLTHGFFQERAKFCGLEILSSALPEKAKNIRVEVKSQLNFARTQNVIGYVEGNEFPDSLLVFSAHYDHLGRMGSETYFPGANDNASGVAMLLDLARHYVKNPPDYSVAFIAFGAEEVGLLGSKYFTENPLFPMKKIGFLVNLDIMGTGDEGITVVNGSVHQQEFDLLSEINSEYHLLPQVKKRGKTSNSDHYWFSENGVPAFFIYTMGGIKAYHDIYDRPGTLPLTKYEEVFRLLVKFAEEL